MAGSSFMSKNTFFRKLDEQSHDVLNWIDLNKEEIYRVNLIDRVEGKFGLVGILTIVNKKGEEFKVWAPSYLLKRIDQKPNSTAYFISMGQERRGANLINKFDVIFEDENEN